MASETTVGATPYLLAVKREKRDEAPEDWIELLKQLPGVDVDNSASTRRVMIHADSDALKSVVDQVGDFCYVEPIIKFHKSEGTSATTSESESTAEIDDVLEPDNESPNNQDAT